MPDDDAPEISQEMFDFVLTQTEGCKVSGDAIHKPRSKKNCVAELFGDYLQWCAANAEKAIVANCAEYIELVIEARRAKMSSKQKPHGDYTLTELDLHLLRYYRFGVQHNNVIFVRRFPDSPSRTNEVVVGRDDFIESCQTMHAYDEKTGKLIGGSLGDHLKDEYTNVVQSIMDKWAKNPEDARPKDLIFGMYYDRDGGWTNLTYRDYLGRRRPECGIIPEAMWEKKMKIAQEEIPAISNTPAELTFRYYDLKSIPDSGDCPYWDSWMETIPDDMKTVFMAWVYSIFVAKNKARQALWLYSRGWSGKTQAINAIIDYLGSQSAMSLADSAIQDQFQASLVGKRLVVFDDCKNPNILRSGLIGKLLGESSTSVEEKFQRRFAVKMFAKVLVASNVVPSVDIGAKNETSRLLYVPQILPSEEVLKRYNKVDENGNLLENDDGDYIPTGDLSLYGNLLKEMPAFLARCRIAYGDKDVVPNDCMFVPPPSAMERMRGICQDPEVESWMDWLYDNYEITGDDDHYVSTTDLMDSFNDKFRSRTPAFAFSNLKSSMSMRFGKIRFFRKMVGGHKLSVCGGIRKRGMKTKTENGSF